MNLSPWPRFVLLSLLPIWSLSCSLLPSPAQQAAKEQKSLQEKIKEVGDRQKGVVMEFEKLLTLIRKDLSEAPEGDVETPVLEKKLEDLKAQLKDLFSQMKEIREEGHDFFEAQEEEARKISDTTQQSNRFRKIIKFRRNFRLLYLTMKESGQKTLHFYKKSRQSLMSPNGRRVKLQGEWPQVSQSLQNSSRMGEKFLKEFSL